MSIGVPMYLVPQYPDLTELTRFHYAEYAAEVISRAPTEFLFYLQAQYNAQYSPRPSDYGFEAVSCMNNWWPSHRGEEREMTLWWMKVPEPRYKPLPVKRKSWPASCYQDKIYTRHIKDLAASGCAFKIGQAPFKASLFNRYFTLMRMPVKPSKYQERILKAHNYRHLDTGELASYYINGWPPAEYSIEKEYEHFNTSQKEWKEKGETLGY